MNESRAHRLEIFSGVFALSITALGLTWLIALGVIWFIGIGAVDCQIEPLRALMQDRACYMFVVWVPRGLAVLGLSAAALGMRAARIRAAAVPRVDPAAMTVGINLTAAKVLTLIAYGVAIIIAALARMGEYGAGGEDPRVVPGTMRIEYVRVAVTLGIVVAVVSGLLSFLPALF